VCHSHYRDDELRARLRVCGQCGYHFPVGARERVEQLSDPATFIEIDADLRSADPLAFVDLKPYTDRLAAAELETGLGDAIVVGSAVIRGHPAVLAVMDFGFMGGSMGSVVGEKLARACDLALTHDVPLISVAASGGARMQENILALMQMAKTVAGIDALQEAGVPFISVLTHPTTGGVIASFAALGDVALAEPGALMSFAGPRVVQQTTRETLPDDFGLAEASLRLGHVDMVVPRPELKDTLGRLLGVLGGQPGEQPELELPSPNGAHGRFGMGRLRELWRRRLDGDGPR
jgi:acetyl-CoA carboxylase carboxyl transferase subunit beta